ncbi:potassium-transporting ATPase subunit KdpC [Superficieibacter sp. 1612_C1]|uniref:potassium-transporting ATPase subunit KdpC n=1 Tax=Superficieibacter sp. 1612_C1 TaxID=2780382 RepID=UPI00188421CE|nr:potassium-transporting ATPase subunit KdpC [Superficieibacter sp. 1612_C1]
MTLLRPAFSLMIFLTVLTGGVYPLLTSTLGQWWFSDRANGSLIEDENGVRGSYLIGQNFTRPDYFHGRPSATAERPYNPEASGGSNLAVSNPAQDSVIAERVKTLRAENPDAAGAVPTELVTASASGLDNNLTPQAVLWQLPRVAKARHLSVEQIAPLIDHATQKPLFSFLGQPVVNIVELNIALDGVKDNK